MPQLYSTTIASPLGTLTVLSDSQAVLLIAFENQKHYQRHIDRIHAYYQCEQATAQSNKVIEQLRVELEGYFTGTLTRFSVPYALNSTPFQQQVQSFLGTIAYGNTVSYASIAKQMGQPRAVRAVANAVGANPLSILLPCHRVIASNGSLGGFAGGVQRKKALHAIEAITLSDDKYAPKQAI